jgi:polar amino acid transport system substrate-binding protein
MFAASRLLVVIALTWLFPYASLQAATATNHSLLVVTEDWPPFSYLAAGGEVTGLNTEIVRSVLNQAGMQSTIQIFPWARAMMMARNRPNTVIFSMSRSKERENQFIWIGELMRRHDMFYRATGRRSISPTSIEEIKSHYSVCVVNKDIVEDDLKRQGFVLRKNYIATGSFDDCMKLVQNGSVPLLVNSPLDLAWALKKHSEIHTTFEPVLALEPSGQEPLYLATSLGTDPDTVKRLRTAFQGLQQSGQLDLLRHQFLERLKIPAVPALPK